MAMNWQEVLGEIDKLDYRSKYELTLALLDRIYSKPVAGFDVDIVYSCKEKFCLWLYEQVQIIDEQEKYFNSSLEGEL